MSPRKLSTTGDTEDAEDKNGFNLFVLRVLRGEEFSGGELGKLSTSVGPSSPRYLRFSARMRSSLTSAMLTVPRAFAGATRRSHDASPCAGTLRPRSSATSTRSLVVRLLGFPTGPLRSHPTAQACAAGAPPPHPPPPARGAGCGAPPSVS